MQIYRPNDTTSTRDLVNPAQTDHRVLIIAAEPLLAALIGALAESSRLRAAFPRANESPQDALARVRPLAAILLDAATDEAASDIFLARASRAKAPVLLFGGANAVSAKRSWALERLIPVFALPGDIDALQTALERLVPAKTPSPRQSQRRDGSRAQRAPVRLSFVDGAGTHWTVYDRRVADRRVAVVDRRFVSEAGVVLRCTVSVKEAESDSIAQLTRQLARAAAVSK